MSIRQLSYRCWELDDPSNGEGKRHLKDKTEADEAVKELCDEHPGATASMRLLDAPCWLVQCDGECEQVIDEEGDGYAFHHGSAFEALDTARSRGWVRRDADGVFCTEDADGELLPLTPEQQEAAGQMRLPGVAS